MKAKYLRWLFVLALGFGLSAGPAHAQRIITITLDGLTIGGGVNFFQGDGDRNSDSDPLVYLASSYPSIFIGVDSRGTRSSLALEYHVDQILVGDRQAGYEGDSFIASLQLLLGYQLGRSFRIYGGLGPAYASRSFSSAAISRINSGDRKGAYFDAESRAFVMLPLGIEIQDTFRIGVQIALTDLLDAQASGPDTDRQFVFQYMYRFDWTK